MSYIVGSAEQLINKQILGSPAASVTFSNIPQNFSHLKLVSTARSAASAAANELYARFNGDSSSNYSLQNMYAANASTVGVNGGISTYCILSSIIGATGTANYPGMDTTFIHNYRDTTFFKGSVSLGGFVSDTTSNLSNLFRINTWRSTSAITSIVLTTSSGSNFVTGSSFYLYGII